MKLNDFIPFVESKNVYLPSPSDKIDEDSGMTFVNSTDGYFDDIAQHFAAHEAEEKERNFKTLDVSEKIERLFLLMDLLVEILELDLSVFVVKRSYNMKNALRNHSFRPLIVFTVWRTSTKEGIGHVNQLCKLIIQLYIRCQQLRMDFEKISIMKVSYNSS